MSTEHVAAKASHDTHAGLSAKGLKAGSVGLIGAVVIGVSCIAPAYTLTAALGPTVFDRLQAANTIGTCSMLLLAVMGFVTGRPDFLDLALIYGMLNILGTIAVLKYFRHGNLGDPGEAEESPAP